MNTDPIDNTLPDDLREMDAMLDSLAARDRADAPEGLVAGAFEASLEAFRGQTPLDIRAQADQLDTLGRIERAGAPADLEREVFVASRGAVVAGRGGPVHAAGREVRTSRRWRIGPVRMAAVFTMVGGAAGALLLMRGGVIEPVEPSSEVLAASFDREMSAFLDLLESSATTETTDRGAEVDSSWTEQLLEWESL